MTNNPWIDSATLLGLPVAFGILSGWALRRLGVPAWLGLLVLVASPSVALLGDWILLGFWNLGLIGLEFGLSFWIFLTARAPFRVGTAVAVLVVVGLMVVEGVTRALYPEPWNPNTQAWPHLTSETLRQPLSRGEIPRLWPAPMDSWPSGAQPQRPFMIHAGDSMIVGRDYPPGERATDHLKQLTPNIDHINLGMSTTGPDIQFLELFDRLDRAPRRPFMVVHHVFVGNDIENLDCDRNFCEGGWLLEYGPEGAAPCRHLRWHFSVRDLIATTGPPYLLSVATTFSRAARFASNEFSTFRIRADRCQTAPLEGPHPQDYERRWEHFQEIFRTERDRLSERGITLVVSILPFRRALESLTPEMTEGRKVHGRMVDVLRRLGIRVLDIWDALYDAVQHDGSERYFLPNGDVHFNVAGHEFYARWLAHRLDPDIALATSAARSPGGAVAVEEGPQ